MSGALRAQAARVGSLRPEPRTSAPIVAARGKIGAQPGVPPPRPIQGGEGSEGSAAPRSPVPLARPPRAGLEARRGALVAQAAARLPAISQRPPGSCAAL